MTFKLRMMSLLNRYLGSFDIELAHRSETWRPTSLLGSQPHAKRVPTVITAPFLKVFGSEELTSPQRNFDFAVVMPTTLRPTIADALSSIFSQTFRGSVQTLIGLDAAPQSRSIIEGICSQIPRNHAVLFFYPGYSTSCRHGGLHPAWDGGVLRTLLSYLANSRHVAYLDDDNWWDGSHLESMRLALEGCEWAYARRWFIHPKSRHPICPDEWESVGPNKGTFADIGGWVDPNCLAIDKLACEAVLRWWSIPLRNTPRAMDADRNVFRLLNTHFKGRPTNQPTVFYAMDETDPCHSARLDAIGHGRYHACGTATPPSRQV